MKKFFPSKIILIICLFISIIYMLFSLYMEIEKNSQGEYINEYRGVQWIAILDEGFIRFYVMFLWVFLILYIIEVIGKIGVYLSDGKETGDGEGGSGKSE